MSGADAGTGLAATVAEGLAQIPFVARAGIEVVEAAPGRVVLRAPAEPNVNHFGTMYAGALYTLGECIGGAVFHTAFDADRWFPLVTGSSIRYSRIALGDITATAELDEAERARVLADAEATGRGSWDLEVELLGARGDGVATVSSHYQMRALDSLG